MLLLSTRSLNCLCFLLAGLGGELRGGKRLDERIREAQKMGFQRIIVPIAGVSRFNSKAAHPAQKNYNAGVIECRTLYDVVAAAFVNPEVSRSLSNRKARRKSGISGSASAGAGLHGPARHFQAEPKYYAEEEEYNEEERESGTGNVPLYEEF